MTASAGNRAPIAIIAEDEELGRLLLAESVTAAGLCALSFDNGIDALEAARSRPAGIVLLDVDMPGLNGYEVCRRIRSSGKLGTVPIVMVTGHDDTEAIDKAFEAGATDYISKPVNWALLPHRLAYILRNAASAAAIERLAYFDTLTGLPNRQRCIDVANRLLREAEVTNEEIACVVLDLNSFKRINETFGHSVGDELLKTVAHRLLSLANSAAKQLVHVSVSRLGGDEFAFLVRGTNAQDASRRLANSACESLAEPIVVDKLELFTTPSVGICVYPQDGADADALLKHADVAMNQAKTSGQPTVCVYTAAMSARLQDWLRLESRLRRAVKGNLLSARFQPKFNLGSGAIVGAEALIRWCDTEHGEIAPARFVPLAEETGLILEIGAWMVRTVCQQLRRWLDLGVRLPVAINISGKELSYGDPARIVEAELESWRVPGELLELEITETALVKDAVGARHNIAKLRKLGCRIALDDFGTGYSSLAYLTRFPPDRVKIDRSFIQNLDRSQSDAALVEAIISLARSLKLAITAEGVERAAQLEWLRSRGCDEAQGYLLSRPLSAQELESALSKAADTITTPHNAIAG